MGRAAYKDRVNPSYRFTRLYIFTGSEGQIFRMAGFLIAAGKATESQSEGIN